MTNGPDPEDENRTMHCGLGELYFTMTGKNPPDNVGEGQVARLAVENSTLADTISRRKETAHKMVEKQALKLVDSVLAADLKCAVQEHEFDQNNNLARPKDLLTGIPEENDLDGTEDKRKKY